jgi:ABC-2 type transport system permease protein
MTSWPAAGGGRMTALTDGWVLVRRELWHLKTQPGQLLPALIFPAAMVVLFGFVFGSAIAVPGSTNYREYLMPGLFSMISVMAILLNALAVASDKAKGVTDRFRSMPMARMAVPFGQAGSDALIGVVQIAIMTGCGLVVGWRAHEGLGRTMAAFGLIVLFRAAMTWIGVYLGLAVKDEKSIDTLGPLIFPVTMIGNTFVPTAHMPGWLRTVADWNPISALTEASRVLFGNPGAGLGHAWPLQHPVLATLGWSVLLLAVFVPLATRAYRDL